MALRGSLRGITCPTVTPIDNGSIDEAALVSLLEHVEAGGIDALFPCGTTGEFPSLSAEERLRVIEFTVEHATVPVVAASAATSVAETLEYVNSAADVGADAAAVVAPYFTTSNAPEGNQRFFEAVVEESPIPLLLYNIPQCTGQRIEPETVAAVAEHDRVLGIKDSSGDLEYFLQVQRETPEEFLCLQGYDALLVPALRMGAAGGVNALSNVFPAAFRETFEHADDERGLERQREVISPLFDACTTYGFAPATKAALAHLEVIPTDEVLPPLVSVDNSEEIASVVDDGLESLER